MEQSLVKLRLTENETRLKKFAEKENQKPVNGTIQKDGKYYLVRLEMEKEKIKSMIGNAEPHTRLSNIPEEGIFCHIYTFLFLFSLLLWSYTLNI